MILFLFSCTSQIVKKSPYDYSGMDEDTKEIQLCMESLLNSCIDHQYPVKLNRYSKIDSVIIDKYQQTINIYKR